MTDNWPARALTLRYIVRLWLCCESLGKCLTVDGGHLILIVCGSQQILRCSWYIATIQSFLALLSLIAEHSHYYLIKLFPLPI